MIRERCSCTAKFESDSNQAIKLWREWRRKHTCPDRDNDPEYNSAANTQTETLQIGFAPNWHPGRQDPALDE
jgi:hypothetical protein